MPQPNAPAPVKRPAAPAPQRPRPAPGSRVFYSIVLVLGLLVFSFVGYSEVEASRLQAHYFAAIARDSGMSSGGSGGI